MAERYSNRDRNRFYDDDFDEGYYDRGGFGRGRSGWESDEGFDSEFSMSNRGYERGTDYGLRGRGYGSGGYGRGYSSETGRGYGSESYYGGQGGFGGQSDHGRQGGPGGYGGDYGRGYGTVGYSSDYGRGYGSGGQGGYGRSTSGQHSMNRGMYGGDYDHDSEFGSQNYRRGLSGSQSGYGRGSYGSGGFSPNYQRSFNRGGYQGDFDEDFDDDDDYNTSPTTWTYTEFWLIPGPFTGMGPQTYQRSDERICEDINERLTQHGRLNARDIQVEVNNCEVTLKGNVQSREMKRMAEDVSDSVLGVKDVHNQLRVQDRQGQQHEQGQPSQQEQTTQQTQQEQTGQPSQQRSETRKNERSS